MLFHQLDIADAKSVDDLRDYISKEFGGWVLDYVCGRCFHALNTTSPRLDFGFVSLSKHTYFCNILQVVSTFW